MALDMYTEDCLNFALWFEKGLDTKYKAHTYATMYVGTLYNTAAHFFPV